VTRYRYASATEGTVKNGDKNNPHIFLTGDTASVHFLRGRIYAERKKCKIMSEDKLIWNCSHFASVFLLERGGGDRPPCSPGVDATVALLVMNGSYVYCVLCAMNVSLMSLVLFTVVMVRAESCVLTDAWSVWLRHLEFLQVSTLPAMSLLVSPYCASQ